MCVEVVVLAVTPRLGQRFLELGDFLDDDVKDLDKPFGLPQDKWSDRTSPCR